MIVIHPPHYNVHVFVPFYDSPSASCGLYQLEPDIHWLAPKLCLCGDRCLDSIMNLKDLAGRLPLQGGLPWLPHGVTTFLHNPSRNITARHRHTYMPTAP